MKKEITIIEKTISPIVTKMENLQIVDNSSLVEAVEYLSKANKYLDSVIEYKKKKTDPINQALKIIRAETNPLEKTLNSLIESIREKMSVYQTNCIKIQKEKELKIANKLSEGKISLDKAITQIGKIEVPSKETATNSGLVQFRETMVLKITDRKLIPLEYHIIDEKHLLEDLKRGLVVPGAEIEISQTVVNYR